MTNQRFRLFAALAIAVIAIVIVGGLAIVGEARSEFIEAIAVLAVGFLFGTTTNGSGLGGGPSQ